MPEYLVRVRVHRLEKWQVEAADEADAEERWEEGECVEVDEDESRPLTVEELACSD